MRLLGPTSPVPSHGWRPKFLHTLCPPDEYGPLLIQFPSAKDSALPFAVEPYRAVVFNLPNVVTL